MQNGDFWGTVEPNWQISPPIPLEIKRAVLSVRIYPLVYRLLFTDRTGAPMNGIRTGPPWVCPESIRSIRVVKPVSAVSGLCASRILHSCSGTPSKVRSTRTSSSHKSPVPPRQMRCPSRPIETVLWRKSCPLLQSQYSERSVSAQWSWLPRTE